LEKNKDIYLGHYELNAYVGGEQDYPEKRADE
jgi:hypothetical protein